MFILKSKNDILPNYEIKKEMVTLGRDRENDIYINDIILSSKHLKFYIEEGELLVEDTNSINGVCINSTRIKPNQKYLLDEDKLLSIGSEKYSFNIEQIAKSNYFPKNEQNLEYTIGKDLSSNMIIDVDTVSRKHLLIKNIGGVWYVIDQNSTNGTYLNSYKNRFNKIKLQRNQILYLATYKLNTNRIFNLIENGGDDNTVIQFSKNILLIGIDPNADIILKNLSISFHHAQITDENGIYYIEDLNSDIGTYVNEERVLRKQKIQIDDKIRIGVDKFVLNIDKNNNPILIDINDNGFRIDCKDISFIVKGKDEKTGELMDKVLLDKISFTVYPGEMVGLMGLSGAGKTTLLKILSGYNKPTNGEVFINGVELYENYDDIKNFIGYVPQDDIIHSELTVYEALFYSSQLRLSNKVNKRSKNKKKEIFEINKRIDEVLKDLGIEKTKDLLIGSPDTEKGISGGQRKRVNIAMELLANPDLLFLDEPTSGLSSVDTKILMDKLKELSNNGKTIILTIHQPSLANYKKMDNNIILTHGKMAYFGQNYPDSIEFFNEGKKDIINDPDNALLGLYEGEQNGKNWKEIYLNSDKKRNFIDKRSQDFRHENGKKFDKKKGSKSSFFKQLSVLTKRYLNIKLKDKLNTGILLAQAPLIALLIAFIFAYGTSGYELYQDMPQILLFILVISAIWFGTINSAIEIVSEKAIYERERLLGLKIIPYVFSKFFILAILSFIQVFFLILIVNYFVPLEISIIKLIGLVYITALMGLGVGLLLSAWAKSPAQSLAIVPLILLPMIIFGGGMIPIKDMHKGAYSISFSMPIRWTLEEIIREYDNFENNVTITKEMIKELPNEYKLIFQEGLIIPREAIGVKNRYEDNNKSIRKDFLYINGSLSNDRGVHDGELCKYKMCIDELYSKINEADRDENDTGIIEDKAILRTNSSLFIYLISLGFILIPILLTIFFLKRKDRN